MVRLLFALTSSAVAVEQTGLLQATVGVHDQLSVKADKVSAMRKISKSWEQKAKSLEKGQGQAHGQAALDAVTSTMQQIVETDCPMQKAADQNLLDSTFANAVTAVDTSLTDNIIPEFTETVWGGVCGAGTQNKECWDQLRYYDGQKITQCAEHDAVAEHCATENPLCACQQLGDVNFQTVRDCLLKAKEWYDSYHDADHFNPADDGAPHYSFSNWEGLTLHTAADLPQERQQCERLQATCASQNTQCEGKQSTYEGDFCSYAAGCKAQHTAYLSNHQTGVQAYNGVKDIVVENTESNEARNIDVCFGALKVQCWVNVIRAHQELSASPPTVPITTDTSLSTFTLESCQAYDPEAYCTDLLTLDPPVPESPVPEEDLPCRQRLTAHSTPSGDGHEFYYNTANDAEACTSTVDFLYGYAPRVECNVDGVIQ